jgi:dephospho-CoA kinase
MSAQVVKKKIKIGLTGNIASGKSEALKHIQTLGYDTIDSDDIVKNIWKDPSHIEALSKVFQRDLQDAKIKALFIKEIFNSKPLLEKLESYIHPIVYDIIESKLETLGQVVVIDIPLLYETHYESKLDAVILIVVDENTQLNRLIERGYDISHAKARMENQMPYEMKIKKNPYIIDGQTDLETFHHDIENILRKIIK